MLSSGITESLQQLEEQAPAWHAMPDEERAAVARACKVQLKSMPQDWAEENMRCLGLNPSERDANHTLSFDPFLFVSTVAERLDLIASALEHKLTYGEAKSRIKQARQLVPLNEQDGDISIYHLGAAGKGAPNCTAELWSDPCLGTERERERALFPKSRRSGDGVCVVLGAGNQNFLSAVDVLERVFMHKECVLLKHHPLRPFLVRPVGHVFAPLADMGVFKHVLDSDVRGAHAALLSSPSVSHVHMTGSAETHGRIIQSLRQANRADVVVTSELGSVTPWIICPGTRDWTKAELDHHASLIVKAHTSNCSMNCISPKLVVLPCEEAWPQRTDFIELLKKKLAKFPQPPPFYPGAHERWNAFAIQYPDAETIDAPSTQSSTKGLAQGEAFAAALGQNLSPLATLVIDMGELGSGNQYAAQNEAFAPVLAVTTVSAKVSQFPLVAARAVNELVFGTLACQLSYMDGPGAELDAVVRELNYGVVGVNCWAALSYGNPLSVWGGAPGSFAVEEPCSGLGFAGNAAQVPHAAKGVIQSPFMNKALSKEKQVPYCILDSMNVVASGKGFAAARVAGVLLRRGFGLLPQRMPKGEKARSRTCCF